MRKRLLLGDGCALFLEGLSLLLSAEFEVVGVTASGRNLVSLAERLRPDVIVLDIDIPELNGIEAARQLVRSVPSAKIILLTQRLYPANIQAAFAAGAKAFVAKQCSSTELIQAIRHVLRGFCYVTPLIGNQASCQRDFDFAEDPSKSFGGALTPRQREVLQLVAEGKTSKEISAILYISRKTVEFHRNSLTVGLGMRKTADLTRYAVSQGIVSKL